MTTVFVNGVTLTDDGWFNDVDALRYDSDGAQYLSFLQAGTGAVSTSAQTEFRRMVWAEQFGLSTGGTAAANTTALQKAIDSLTSGGIVHIGPGAFVFNNIIIPATLPIIIRGSGVPDYVSGALGTELRSTLRDGVTPAIKVDSSGTAAGYSFAQFSMEDITLSGGTFAEVVTGSIGQGGAALGNFVGLHLKNRHQATLRYVRIIGFDQDGLRLQDSYYFSAHSSVFQYNGTYGVKGIGANVGSFYNCHFQYNTKGTLDLRSTVNCAWEGNWKSGAHYNTTGLEAHHYSPYFENNNGSNTAGEGDIFADSTNFMAAMVLESPYFASGGTYSAKPVATHNYTGKCIRLFVNGALRVFHASPQVYPLFNLVGTTQMFDSTAYPKNFANYMAFTSGSGGYNDLCYGMTSVTLTTSTLTHFGFRGVRLSAGGALNLDTIDPSNWGGRLTIVFADANITVRDGAGNLSTAGNMVSSADDILELIYDVFTNKWQEVSRSVN